MAGNPVTLPLDDYRRFADFHHTSWTVEDGAPGDIYAIAQTPDGWLWLGGPRGLFRFDGMTFERVELEGRDPSLADAVYSLFSEDNGDLWIGYGRSGACLLRNGVFRHFDERGGVINATIGEFERDSTGTLWAASYTGLLRFNGEQWHNANAELGLAGVYPFALHLDSQGTLWMTDDNRIFFLPRGESKVRDTNITVSGSTSFLRSPDGRSWYENASGAHLLPGQVTTTTRTSRGNSRKPLAGMFDGNGDFWSLRGGFLRHYERPVGALAAIDDRPSTDRFTQKDGLSGSLHSMIEDREGNIWTASAGGLDRFHANNIRRLQLEWSGMTRFALAPADGNAIYIGNPYSTTSQAAGLWKFDGELVRIGENQIDDVGAADVDGHGTLWVGGTRGIWRLGPNEAPVKLPELPEGPRGQILDFLAVDSTGAPWVSTLREDKAYRFSSGVWQPIVNRTDLSTNRARSVGRDVDGNLWFGHDDHSVTVLRKDGLTVYNADQGLEVGTPRAFSFGRWKVVAGAKRVAIFDGTRFNTLAASDEPAILEGVTGMVETPNGDLWLNGFRGVLRIARENLEDALRKANYTVTLDVFDLQDGYPGSAQTARPFPSLIRARDGQLWFAGTVGIGRMHPDLLRRNLVPPPVLVRSFVADKRLYRVPGKVVLPKGTHDLQINYTALSYTRPERVKFQYRLEGYDRRWIDAGTRREAYYTNLPPGAYTFHVRAANDSGVWNEIGASKSFEIPAMFHQTWLFTALCVAASLAMLWGLFALRIRQVTSRVRARLEERLDERGRIARELHDTLLQGVQGLILQFQSVANRIDGSSQAQAAMTKALDRADALLIEGRDRVNDLRRASLAPLSLRNALLEAAARAFADHSANLRVIENGTPRELHPIVREEAECIAIEAMLNALRHAAAKSVEVEISYERRQLLVNVRDDGRGMDESMLHRGREGHYGLLGMRERAARIRAQLSIWSRPSAGTEVSLTVPAAMAYVRGSSSWRSRLSERLRLLRRRS